MIIFYNRKVVQGPLQIKSNQIQPISASRYYVFFRLHGIMGFFSDIYKEICRCSNMLESNETKKLNWKAKNIAVVAAGRSSCFCPV